jgi:hypothetical protein
MSRCANLGCARSSRTASGFCCSDCLSGGHSASCNSEEFPEIGPSAAYLTSPTKEIDLLNRLTRAVALSATLQAEFQTLRNISLSLGISWGGPLESLLAHMEIDLKYLGAEIKEMTGI